MTTPTPPTPQPADLAQAWQRLPRELDRATVEAAFTPRLPDTVVGRMLDSPRLQERLADRLASHLHLTRPGPEDFNDPGARIVLRGPKALRKVVELAGPIRHRDRLRLLVLREARAEIAAAIGTEAFAAAQACPSPPQIPGGEWSAAQLIEACRRDGPVCVASWMRTLPNSVGGWIAALMPDLADISVPDYPDRESLAAASMAAAMVLEQTP